MRRDHSTIRVGLLVEVGVYREALEHALAHAGLRVVARHDDADVVLVDVTLPDGIETLRRISAETRGLRLLALAVRDVEAEVLSCIEAGAVGYIQHDASLEELADEVRRAARDEPFASPHIVAKLMRRVAALSADGNQQSFEELTSRELEVVELIEQGLSNKEIAARLSIAVTTVKNHVHSILEKLKVRRRGEAASLVRGSTASNGPRSDEVTGQASGR